MTIYNFLTLVGGLAMFLFGMDVMGKSLEKMGGSKLGTILEKMTDSRIKGVLLGLFVTAVIQSSGAVTVMAVGFVNSGIMALRQVIGIIMGANIGTTVTAWILSLAGIEGSNLFVNLLKPSSFAPVLAFIGIILVMFCKGEKKHNVGYIVLGFGLLMIGMTTMSDSMEGLKDVPQFTSIFLLRRFKAHLPRSVFCRRFQQRGRLPFLPHFLLFWVKISARAQQFLSRQ